MSFDQFSRKSQGSGNNPNSDNDNVLIEFGAPVTSDEEYRHLCDTIGRNIFQISNNVASIQKMTQFFGTEKDTPEVHQNMHQLTESTRQMAKLTSDELKRLSNLIGDSSSSSQNQKKSKLTRDFEVVLRRYQEVERFAMEKSKDYLIRARAVSEQKRIEEERLQLDAGVEEESLITSNAKFQQLQELENEINYNDTLITQREEGMKEIETAILEVNEIFRDLGTLVNEQQYMLDNIEANIESTAVRTGEAVDQLSQANRTQKSARNCKCFFLLILVFIVAIIVVVILATK